jgi:CheY-like chemotaxis protein
MRTDHEAQLPVVPTECELTGGPSERALDRAPVEDKAKPAEASPDESAQALPAFRKTVFVAEDDDDMREALAAALRAGGYDVRDVRDGAELLDLLLGTVDVPLLRPHVVVADVRMPSLSGLGVLATLRRGSRNIPVLLITALTDESVQTVGRRLGAIGVLRKPFDMNDLLMAVLHAGDPPGGQELS